MTSTQFYINCILVIDDASNTRHWRIDESFLLAQSPAVLAVREWTRVRQEAHVANTEVATPGNVDVAVVVEVRATDVTIETHRAIALCLLPYHFWVSDILQPATCDLGMALTLYPLFR